LALILTPSMGLPHPDMKADFTLAGVGHK